MNVIDVAGLNVSFGRGGGPVVDDVALSVAEGECLALVGESGSGKSVTARALLGLAGPDGTVRAARLTVAGHDARDFGPREWRRLRGPAVGMVLQDALVSLDPLRRVGAEVEEPLRLHTDLSRAARRERVVRLLTDVGVPDAQARRAQYPHELSGGLRQRALIASALAAEPRLLIADEPTTALDPVVQQTVLRLLAATKEAGRGLLLISHDLSVVAELADRVAVMRAGRIVETGTVAEVCTAPRHPYTRDLVAATPRRRSEHRPVEGPEVLRFDRVSRRYGARTAVDDVSFTLRAGEVVSLVGESGSGKSTIARLALGLIEPDHGEIRLNGQPWSGLPERRRRARRRTVQLIAQNPMAAFDPRFTVAGIVGEALPRPGRRSRIEALLSTVELDPALAGRRPHQLSGGQRQRVAIARALAPEPSVLVCDEPVSALDVTVQDQILRLLERLRRENGLALLFITHDLAVAGRLSDGLLVLKDGVVVERGDAAEVLDRPRHPYTRALLAAVPDPLFA